ncbi:Late histone H2A.L3 [Armadillidium nasatum]|uniref:Histone H2A n=1 Tax=Armadillidium nasatum TaxID=96803 RepID=A0A5N5SZW4_9CRUS|nr:Late histone H2A.L3 [Armadillidium nasatum]
MTGRGKGEEKKKRQTVSARSGLVLSVSRMLRYLKIGKYAKKVRVGAAIYTAAVIEYLIAEMLELAGKAAIENKKKTITARHILLAVKSDEEIDNLLSHVTISEGGVPPHIEPVLLPKKTFRERKD